MASNISDWHSGGRREGRRRRPGGFVGSHDSYDIGVNQRTVKIFVFVNCARIRESFRLCGVRIRSLSITLESLLGRSNHLRWDIVHWDDLLFLRRGQSSAEIHDFEILVYGCVIHLLVHLVHVAYCLRWHSMCIVAMMFLLGCQFQFSSWCGTLTLLECSMVRWLRDCSHDRYALLALLLFDGIDLARGVLMTSTAAHLMISVDGSFRSRGHDWLSLKIFRALCESRSIKRNAKALVACALFHILSFLCIARAANPCWAVLR